MARLALANEFQNALLDAGFVRLADDTDADVSLPTSWVQPEGYPAPNETYLGYSTGAATVSIVNDGGLPTKPLGQWYELRDIDVHIRAANAAVGEAVATDITYLLDGQRQFMLGSLLVQECLCWRPWQCIPTGTPEHGIVGVVSFRIFVRRESYGS